MNEFVDVSRRSRHQGRQGGTQRGATPNRLASYTLDPQVSVTTLMYSDTIKVPFSKLSGRYGRRSITVKPTKSGSRIDPKSVKVEKIGGEKSGPMRFT